MKNVGWLFLALLIAYACAVVAPLLRYRLRGRASIIVGWCFVPIVLACTLLIPSANSGLRAAFSVASADISFKLVEYFRHLGNQDRGMVLREYYRFLIPFPVFSAVYPDHKRRLVRPESPWPQVLRLLGGIIGFTIAVQMGKALAGNALLRSSFVLNHTVMLMIFVLGIESFSRALCGLERLAGFDTGPLIRSAYLSRTISEFWRRYNYRVHDWHYRNIFQATGGRRAPVRSMLLVFLFSGVYHEVAFALATSRLTGYQLAFFTIQGPAALASGRLERLARRGGIAGKIMAHGATILFMGVTSVLFFDGLSRIFPFVYGGQSPLP
jgi:hypothetical protein